MPTTRTYYPRFAKPAQTWHHYVFRDLPIPHEVRPKPHVDEYGAEAEWRAMCDEVVAEFAAERPGTRPTYWWLYDAPEERRRLGGVGTEWWRAVTFAHPEHRPEPFWWLGMPARWLTDYDVRSNGLTTNFAPTILPDALPYDPQDPPVYEAEGVYLERLGLLLPGEVVVDREPQAAPLEIEYRSRVIL